MSESEAPPRNDIRASRTAEPLRRWVSANSGSLRFITPSESGAPVRSRVEEASRTNSVASRASVLLGIAIPAIVARMALMCCQDARAEGGWRDGEPTG
jgi:hypothetical protein